MKEQTYTEVITSNERNQIAGRFAIVGRGKDCVVVGCLGSLYAHDLNRRQRQFIAAWYFLEQAGTYAYDVLHEYPESTLPPKNFNNFIRITKQQGRRHHHAHPL